MNRKSAITWCFAATLTSVAVGAGPAPTTRPSATRPADKNVIELFDGILGRRAVRPGSLRRVVEVWQVNVKKVRLELLHGQAGGVGEKSRVEGEHARED